LKITGTIGVLLFAAADKKMVFKDTLDDLVACGFWLGKEEYDKLVIRSGEICE